MKSGPLNNVRLEAIRKNSQEYKAVITDLVLMGAIPEKVYEHLLGHKLPDYLKRIDVAAGAADTSESDVDEEE